MIEKINLSGELVIITNRFGTFIAYESPIILEAYSEGKYQNEITALLETGNYNVFADVGSYIGYFSIVASHFCKKVVAFEAVPFIYGILLDNCKFLKNVECRYKYITNKEDMAICGKKPFSMLSNYHRDINLLYNIPIGTLDNELLQLAYSNNFSMLIKMDIEGFELRALKGATQLLKYPSIHWHIDIHEQCGVFLKDILPFFEDRDVEILGPKIIIVRGNKNEEE